MYLKSHIFPYVAVALYHTATNLSCDLNSTAYDLTNMSYDIISHACLFSLAYPPSKRHLTLFPNLRDGLVPDDAHGQNDA